MAAASLSGGSIVFWRVMPYANQALSRPKIRRIDAVACCRGEVPVGPAPHGKHGVHVSARR
jgi:hypothetical protein